MRALKTQFCPKKSLWLKIFHLDGEDCGGFRISCSITIYSVKLTFWVKAGMDLGPLLTYSDG